MTTLLLSKSMDPSLQTQYLRENWKMKKMKTLRLFLSLGLPLPLFLAMLRFGDHQPQQIARRGTDGLEQRDCLCAYLDWLDLQHLLHSSHQYRCRHLCGLCYNFGGNSSSLAACGRSLGILLTERFSLWDKQHRCNRTGWYISGINETSSSSSPCVG